MGDFHGEITIFGKLSKGRYWSGPRFLLSISTRIVAESTTRSSDRERFLQFEKSRVSAMASTNPVTPKASDNESEGSVQSTADMTAFVQNLLVQMQTRFQAMSVGIVEKIDEMGKKIDDLEVSINNLKAELESEPTAKSNLEEGKPSDETS